MKRLHIHVNTSEDTFPQTVEFYSALLGANPTKEKPSYSKWLLDDPSVNFVVEVLEIDGDTPGVHHLGLQVDEPAELSAVSEALRAIKLPLLDVGETVCCYSQSEKVWSVDPSGVRWEAFRSTADVDAYGEKTAAETALYTSDMQ